MKVRHYPTFLQGKVTRHLCDTPVACLRQRQRLAETVAKANVGQPWLVELHEQRHVVERDPPAPFGIGNAGAQE